MHRTTLSVMPMPMPALAPGPRSDDPFVGCADPGPEEAVGVGVAAVLRYSYSRGREQKNAGDEGQDTYEVLKLENCSRPRHRK